MMTRQWARPLGPPREAAEPSRAAGRRRDMRFCVLDETEIVEASKMEASA